VVGGEQARTLEHAELEARLVEDGRELIRVVLQDHLDPRADAEQRAGGIVGADGVPEREDVRGLSCDAKGVVMRQEALREQTRRQAQDSEGKLKTPGSVRTWIWRSQLARLSRSGAVEEEAGGGCAGFFESKVLVLGELDRAEGGAGEEFVEDFYGEVAAEYAGVDASFQHRSDRCLELALVGFLDSGQVADEHRVPVADRDERAQDAPDRVFYRRTLEAGVGEPAGGVAQRIGR